MKLPDPTIRNVLVTPFLLVRIPIFVSGRGLELLGLALQELASLVPAWTDYGRGSR